MGRLERWAKPTYITVGISGFEENPSLLEAIRSAPRHLAGDDFDENEVKGDVSSLFKGAKEVILDRAGDKFEMHLICYSLDGITGCLRLGATWTALDLDENDVKRNIATAMAFDVPVYPENDSIVDDLTRIYSDLIEDGFEHTTDDVVQRFKYARERGIVIDGEGRWKTNGVESIGPADVLLAKARASAREQRLTQAEAMLSNLRAGIDGLAVLLTSDATREAALQGWLTRFPIIFVLHDRSVKPQFRLGAEYVMDYALEHISGNFDLVEIESSHHKLYKASGDPTAALIHAEQQVLDWLEWAERNSAYARERMPFLVRPVGLVVIGRRSSLSEREAQKLAVRNSRFGGTMQVLTYDDLLDRAKIMLDLLTRRTDDSDA